MLSEPRICLREGQNKEKEPFLKVASWGALERALESLGQLYIKKRAARFMTGKLHYLI